MESQQVFPRSCATAWPHNTVRMECRAIVCNCCAANAFDSAARHYHKTQPLHGSKCALSHQHAKRYLLLVMKHFGVSARFSQTLRNCAVTQVVGMPTTVSNCCAAIAFDSAARHYHKANLFMNRNVFFSIYTQKVTEHWWIFLCRKCVISLTVLLNSVVPKVFLIAYHLWVPHCQHVPPCSRKSQSTKYHLITNVWNFVMAIF